MEDIMKPMYWRIAVGGVLILVGLLALLNSVLGINLGELVWAGFFLLAGLIFIFVLLADRKQWWAAIPGFTLAGIGALIGLEELAPRFANQFGATFVVGGIGISFLVVYFLNQHFWWALIPAGTMLSIVALLAIEPFSQEPVWAFFLGLAATFGVLTLVPVAEGKRMRWPLIPAAVLGLMGIIFMIGDVRWAGYFWPVFLILLGIFFIFRATRPKA
jgi:uncharacterized membrane protein HdeD (DUF308 family)